MKLFILYTDGSSHIVDNVILVRNISKTFDTLYYETLYTVRGKGIYVDKDIITCFEIIA